jgi:hypothetical protein
MKGRIVNSGMRVVVMTFFIAIFASQAFAGDIQTLDVVEVNDSVENPLGINDSASEGTVPREEVQSLPYYRPGEILESTLGLIVTQHSGEGKANQYFLRGVNLDHGTDCVLQLMGCWSMSALMSTARDMPI